MLDQIRRYHEANDDFIETAEYLIKLAQNAQYLFENARPEQQRDLLKLLLSNCTLTSGNLHYSYKKTFDAIIEGNKTANWLGS